MIKGMGLREEDIRKNKNKAKEGERKESRMQEKNQKGEKMDVDVGSGEKEIKIAKKKKIQMPVMLHSLRSVVHTRLRLSIVVRRPGSHHSPHPHNPARSRRRIGILPIWWQLRSIIIVYGPPRLVRHGARLSRLFSCSGWRRHYIWDMRSRWWKCRHGRSRANGGTIRCEFNS